MNASARILMCTPDFYGIEYEINPWMNTERQTDHAVAVSQWNDLRQILMGHGATIELLTPVAGLPDLVFTANAALKSLGVGTLLGFDEKFPGFLNLLGIGGIG